MTDLSEYVEKLKIPLQPVTMTLRTVLRASKKDCTTADAWSRKIKLQPNATLQEQAWAIKTMFSTPTLRERQRTQIAPFRQML